MAVIGCVSVGLCPQLHNLPVAQCANKADFRFDTGAFCLAEPFNEVEILEQYITTVNGAIEIAVNTVGVTREEVRFTVVHRCEVVVVVGY